jgi:hypothetical protein
MPNLATVYNIYVYALLLKRFILVRIRSFRVSIIRRNAVAKTEPISPSILPPPPPPPPPMLNIWITEVKVPLISKRKTDLKKMEGSIPPHPTIPVCTSPIPHFLR